MADDRIIERIRNGDREAFNDLCREKYIPLLAYARLFLKGAWAEDVVQDVLYGVWKNRDKLDSRGNMQGYLLRSVYNRSLNYLGKGKMASSFRSYYRNRIVSMMNDYYSPDANPVIAKIFDTDIRSAINSAIAELPPRCKEVFTLCYFNDFSYKEAAAVLGISRSTVENHMHAALKQLRLKLSEI